MCLSRHSDSVTQAPLGGGAFRCQTVRPRPRPQQFALLCYCSLVSSTAVHLSAVARGFGNVWGGEREVVGEQVGRAAAGLGGVIGAATVKAAASVSVCTCNKDDGQRRREAQRSAAQEADASQSMPSAHRGRRVADARGVQPGEKGEWARIDGGAPFPSPQKLLA